MVVTGEFVSPGEKPGYQEHTGPHQRMAPGSRNGLNVS